MNVENILLKDAIITSIREFFKDKKFVEIFPTRLGPYSLVNGGIRVEGLFPIEYYNPNYYLSQTAQNVLERYAAEVEKCFSIAPCYRREHSQHQQSLSEYWNIEAEWKGDSFDSIKDTVRELFEKLYGDLKNDEKLKKFNLNIEWLHEFKNETEYKSGMVYEEPILITHHPVNRCDWKIDRVKEGSEHRDENDPCKDLCVTYPLGRPLQVLSGGVRSTDVKDIRSRFMSAAQSMNVQNMDELLRENSWYFDLMREAEHKTCGFGLGVERLMMCILKKNDVLEVCDTTEDLFRRKFINKNE